MGLLDALFDPSSYNGGGLLGALPSYPFSAPQDAPASFADRFNAVPNAPQPFVPSGRSFDPAQFNPAMYAGAGASPFDTGAPPLTSPGLPPHFMQPLTPQSPPIVASGGDGEDSAAPSTPASPIAVGNYQMPRVGDASAFVPPPQAQPAQPMPQPAPAAPAPSLGDNVRAGFANLNSGGNPISALVNVIDGFATGTRHDRTGVAQQLQAKQMGFAANALLQKGVDPVTVQAAVANPEIMKTVIAQTFGPQTVQSLRNGSVARNGKTTRAYEPKDKIPSGVAKDDKGNLSFIPGGPADPAYQRLLAAKAADPNAVFVLGKGGELYKKDAQGNVTIVHKNDAAPSEATLDDRTVGMMAQQYLAGDRTVLQNLGRGAQGAANLVKLRGEISNQAAEQGLDGKAIVNNFNEQAGALAGQRPIGTRAANISLAANEANNVIPIALDASAKVPRGEWMPWNKMVQAYQTGSSSPELARFVAATNSLVNSYVRAVSPSGVPTDSMREHAYSMLNSAQSPQAYQAVTSIMQDEMKAAMAAPGQVRKELRHEDDRAGEKNAPAPGAYVWSPDKGLQAK